MDVPVSPALKHRRQRRRWLLIAGSIALLALAAIGLSRLQPAAPVVQKASVWADTVKRGPMLREIRGNGTLVPEDIRWITASSPGRIERIPLLPGVTVASNTVLVELSNPELVQAAFDADARVSAGEAALEKLKVQIESDRLTQQSVVASLKSDWVLASLEADADEKLRQDGLVPNLAAKRSRTKADELMARHALEQQRLAISTNSARAQLQVQQAEVATLRMQSQLKKQQVEALKVRAGFAGVLQRLGDDRPLQPGQQLNAGAAIARIADPSRLKAEIKVAETQAKDIQRGQAAVIDTRNGVIPGHVMRIDPAVQNGTVTVDVALDRPLPKGARPDLSVDGTIELERLHDVLYVGRPVQSQPDSQVSLFKLVDNGRAAVRVPVHLGHSSVSTVQVLHGLALGDQVILSDMSQWDSRERVRIR
jgi:HlyD family secretion protein